MAHSASEGCKGFGGAVALISGILLLPVVYVLSIGPVVWLVYHAGVPKSVLVIYFPLRLVCEHSETVAAWLSRYARWWGG